MGDDEPLAGDVLRERLAGQRDRLVAAVEGVGRDEPDAVHQARLASRRLRAALATFRPLVDRAVTEPVRDELQWFARALGQARDAEVVGHRLRTALAGEAAPMGPVWHRLDAHLRPAQEPADDVVSSDRARRLLDSLDQLVEDPPFTALARRRARPVLRKRVRKDLRRLRRRMAVVADLEPAEREHVGEALHDVRKAAKRLRYACEAARPTLGKRANRLRKKARRLADVLGERQDTVVARAVLARVSHEAAAAGENTFTYGRLHEREVEVARARDHDLDRAWADLDRSRVVGWLD